MSHYHMASIPNSSGLVPNSLEQSLHIDRQQQSQHNNNNDVSVQPLCMLYMYFSLLCVQDEEFIPQEIGLHVFVCAVFPNKPPILFVYVCIV